MAQNNYAIFMKMHSTWQLYLDIIFLLIIWHYFSLNIMTIIIITIVTHWWDFYMPYLKTHMHSWHNTTSYQVLLIIIISLWVSLALTIRLVHFNLSFASCSKSSDDRISSCLLYPISCDMCSSSIGDLLVNHHILKIIIKLL